MPAIVAGEARAIGLRMIKWCCCGLPQRSLVAIRAQVGRRQMVGRLPRNWLQAGSMRTVMA